MLGKLMIRFKVFTEGTSLFAFSVEDQLPVARNCNIGNDSGEFEGKDMEKAIVCLDSLREHCDLVAGFSVCRTHKCDLSAHFLFAFVATPLPVQQARRCLLITVLYLGTRYARAAVRLPNEKEKEKLPCKRTKDDDNNNNNHQKCKLECRGVKRGSVLGSTCTSV